MTAWTFPAPGGVSAAPAVRDGIVYFGTVNGAFYAVDAATRIERWVVNTGSWIQSSPEVTPDLVYFGSDDKNVYALERSTGRQIWRVEFAAEVSAPVTAAGNTVYAGSVNGDLYALNARTSRRRWLSRSGGPITGRPIVVDGLVIFGSSNGDLHALAARNGKGRWQLRKVASSTVSSPAAAQGIVYAGSSRGLLTALVARSGRTRWRTRVGKGSVTSPAISGASVLAVAAEGKRSRVSALRARDGKRKWSRLLPAPTVASPAVVDGILYIGAKDGFLYAINVRTGKLRWRLRTGGDVDLDSSPVVASGRAYLGSWDGNLYAVGAPRLADRQLPATGRSAQRRDARGDATSKRQFPDILRAGARFARYRSIPGIAFEMLLAAPPPTTTKKQVAYVWAIDTTLDSTVDYYLFVDIVPGARGYRATLERNTPSGLVTVDDRVPFSVVGRRRIRAFLPVSPHLSPGGATPTVQWYAYSYIDKLPAQDTVTEHNRYFTLRPPK